MKSSITAVALLCGATNGVPVIPDQFYAEEHGNTTSTIASIPSGTIVIKHWYDYTNKRERKDFDTGVTKMYDYKTLVDPGNEKPGGPGNNPIFPSPQGFKFRTDDLMSTCCWLWLVGDASTQYEPETMEKFEVEKKAVDEGLDAKGEHWSSVKKFPFLQTDDWWFKNGTVSLQRLRCAATAAMSLPILRLVVAVTFRSPLSALSLPPGPFRCNEDVFLQHLLHHPEGGIRHVERHVRQREVRRRGPHGIRPPRLPPDVRQVQAVRCR